MDKLAVISGDIQNIYGTAKYLRLSQESCVFSKIYITLSTIQYSFAQIW